MGRYASATPFASDIHHFSLCPQYTVWHLYFTAKTLVNDITPPDDVLLSTNNFCSHGEVGECHQSNDLTCCPDNTKTTASPTIYAGCKSDRSSLVRNSDELISVSLTLFRRYLCCICPAQRHSGVCCRNR